MKGFRASFYKDRKMFRGINGILMIVLPLVLCAAMFFGMNRSSSASFLQPFSIAVRDEDRTMMSRSLISQMKKIEMFSSVDSVKDQSDQELLKQGYTGVITIPKDFFYSIYDAEENPVKLTLNERQPLNSAILKSVFTSVMDIISSDQSADYGMYRYLNRYNYRQLDQESSEHVLKDALGRQNVFDSEIEPADLMKPLLCRLAATVLFMMAAGESIAALKTVSEEKRNGIFTRYRACGGSTFAYMLSKFIAVVLTMIPSGILAGIFLQVSVTEIPVLILLSLLEIFCVFSIVCFISVLSRSSQSACRNGNLYLLFCLVTGGTLWSFKGMTGKASGSCHLYVSLMAMEREWHLSSILKMELPYLLICVLTGIISLFLLHTDHTGSFRKTHGKDPFLLKYRMIHGGTAGIFMILIVCAVCGWMVGSTQSTGLKQMRIAVTDEDHSHTSEQLIRDLKQQQGIEVSRNTSAKESQMTLTGDVEGQLIIPAGYEERIQNQEDPDLHYESSSGSFSTQSVREIIAGHVIEQQAVNRALKEVQKEQDRKLSDEEKKDLNAEIKKASERLPDLYQISEKKGSGNTEELFQPSVEAFGVMAVMMFLMILGSFFAGKDARAVENRMFSVKNGIVKSYWLGDLPVLITSGFLIMLVTQVPSWMISGYIPWHEIPVYFMMSVVFSGMILSLNRLTKDESLMNGFAPFLAMILCLAGGCFVDLNAVSEGFRIVSYLSPAGAALQAMNGNIFCVFLLLMEGILFAFTGMPVRK